LHIEGKEGGERDIPALKLFADIYVTDFVDRYIPSAGDAMRSRDIVRAKITQFEPMLKASTRDGIVWALSMLFVLLVEQN
jgi:exosome complex RNA-binding protein Csl4